MARTHEFPCPTCLGDRRRTYREWGGRGGLYSGPTRTRRCHTCQGRSTVRA